jgi:hypothetical protein
VGFLDYEEPAEYPYEVVRHSMENALRRLTVYNESHQSNTKLRPWIQDFDLKIPYNATMVRSEIDAVYDAAGDDFAGFMLWNSWNIYTKDALQPAELK